MSTSQPNGDVTPIVRRVVRRLALRRLLTILVLDAGYLFLLYYRGFSSLGDWRLPLVLPIASTVLFALVDCMEIYCGFPFLLFVDRWVWIARWRRRVIRILALLLVLCAVIIPILSHRCLQQTPVPREQRIWARATVNGKPAWLVFDTGSRYNFLYEAGAER